MPARILVVDDDETLRRVVGKFLRQSGFEVCEAASVQSGRSAFASERPDAVVLDHVLPDGDALDLLPRFKALRPHVPVIVLTGHGSIDLAVRAVKQGAEDFLTKPVALRSLATLIEQALQRVRFAQPRGGARRPATVIDPFLGRSNLIRELEAEAALALNSTSSVLITGATGTGKGVLARYLHEHGARRDRPFVALNCSSLTSELLRSELFGHAKGSFTGAARDKKGLFEIADEGTLFLDEIGDLDLRVQPRLLTALEDKTFRRLGGLRRRQSDVRLLSATQRDLGRLIHEGKFRTDLYYRISTITLEVPRLEERREDIPELANSILDSLATESGQPRRALSPQALVAVVAHDWPGNLRELRNALERALIAASGTRIERTDLRFNERIHDIVPVEAPADGTLARLEREQIERVLSAERGHVTRSAQRLGIPRSTFYAKLHGFGIHPDDYRQ